MDKNFSHIVSDDQIIYGKIYLLFFPLLNPSQSGTLFHL